MAAVIFGMQRAPGQLGAVVALDWVHQSAVCQAIHLDRPQGASCPLKVANFAPGSERFSASSFGDNKLK